MKIFKLLILGSKLRKKNPKKKKKDSFFTFTTAHLLRDSYSKSISACGVWKPRAKYRGRNFTYIHLD